MNKSNKFIFSASGISKELIFKIYQNKIESLKFPSTILMILILKTKLFRLTVKQVDEKKVFKIFIVKNGLILATRRVCFNIILLIAILIAIHLMFPDSRWIKNVSDSCASAPISPSVPATHQGIFSSLHTQCTRENSVSIHVLHSPGASSVTVKTETCLKSHLSISETLIDDGCQYIKLDSIFISTYIEAFKTIKQFKYLSFQIIIVDQISCVFFNPPHLLSLKLVCFYPLYSNIINEKFKNFKRNSIISYVLILFIKNVLILYPPGKYSLPLRVFTYKFSNTGLSTQHFQ